MSIGGPVSTVSYPDGELVSRALAGDSQSFVALCDRYRSRMWRIAASVALGPDVEDVTQEAVLRAYRALNTYHGGAPFAAWLCRITLNTAHDFQRSAWRRRVTLFEEMPEEDGGQAESADDEVQRRELQRRIRHAVAQLPQQQRDPIWLHFFEGFSIAEVARLDGTPEGTVRSRLRAGLKKLSQLLASELTEALPLSEEASFRLETSPRGC